MRAGKKSAQKQQAFAFSINPPQPTDDPQALLNQMYQRVKSKSIQENKQTNTSQSNIILMSYLTKSHHQANDTKQTIQKINDIPTANPQNNKADFNKFKRPKKFSQNERIKTEFDDLDSVSQVQFLRRENEMLRNKLLKSQKKIICLQPLEGEVEYLKKLIFIQNNQIQKLRRGIKNAKRQKLEIYDKQNQFSECASTVLKDKNKKQAILISDETYILEREGKKCDKKSKCFHKLRGQGGGNHIRTSSTLEVNAHIKNQYGSKSREQMTKKSACKMRKQKNFY